MKKMLKGFTLVEIMIVVAIIAILAAVAIPNFVRYRKTSQMNACISNLKQLQAAIEQARMANEYEGNMTDLVATDKFIKVTPTCPAGGAYTLPAKTDDATDPACSSQDAGYEHTLNKTTTTATT